ncbi:unnamed protein product [Lampetra fluviatilis]
MPLVLVAAASSPTRISALGIASNVAATSPQRRCNVAQRSTSVGVKPRRKSAESGRNATAAPDSASSVPISRSAAKLSGTQAFGKAGGAARRCLRRVCF